MKKQAVILSALFTIISQNSFTNDATTNPEFINSNSYSDVGYNPYLELGGTRFFSGTSKGAIGADLFVPLWQTSTDLIFTDARIYDRSGKPFEGNIHLGYRQLIPEDDTMFGIYAAFDRNRSLFGNYFNQIAIGAEAWVERFFVGANFYQPIGDAEKVTGVGDQNFDHYDANDKHAYVTRDKKHERSMRGGDAQVGYELIDGLTAYVGGYYFRATDVDTIVGPKARVTYDYSLQSGKRIFGVFDKLGLEVGVQRDNTRGTKGYVSANLRIGLTPDKNTGLKGVSRHMVDLIRRDVDIVSAEEKAPRIVEEGAYTEDGKRVKFYESKDEKDIAEKNDKGKIFNHVSLGEVKEHVLRGVNNKRGAVSITVKHIKEAKAKAEAKFKPEKAGSKTEDSKKSEEERAAERAKEIAKAARATADAAAKDKAEKDEAAKAAEAERKRAAKASEVAANAAAKAEAEAKQARATADAKAVADAAAKVAAQAASEAAARDKVAQAAQAASDKANEEAKKLADEAAKVAVEAARVAEEAKAAAKAARAAADAVKVAGTNVVGDVSVPPAKIETAEQPVVDSKADTRDSASEEEVATGAKQSSVAEASANIGDASKVVVQEVQKDDMTEYKTMHPKYNYKQLDFNSAIKSVTEEKLFEINKGWMPRDVAKNIIALRDGNIEIKSAEGKVKRFKFDMKGLNAIDCGVICRKNILHLLTNE